MWFSLFAHIVCFCCVFAFCVVLCVWVSSLVVFVCCVTCCRLVLFVFVCVNCLNIVVLRFGVDVLLFCF